MHLINRCCKTLLSLTWKFLTTKSQNHGSILKREYVKCLLAMDSNLFWEPLDEISSIPTREYCGQQFSTERSKKTIQCIQSGDESGHHSFDWCVKTPWHSPLFIFILEEKTLESTSDAKVYQDMTTVFPPESISVPLILNGILEQVGEEESLDFPARELLGRSSDQQSVGARPQSTGWCGTILAREADVTLDGRWTTESKTWDDGRKVHSVCLI